MHYPILYNLLIADGESVRFSTLKARILEVFKKEVGKYLKYHKIKCFVELTRS